MTANAGFSQPYFIVTWAESGVAVILLSARCYTAVRILHHVATDLYLALVTFVLGAGSMATITAGAANGLGVGQTLLTNEQQYFALLYGWLSQFLALIAIGLAKVVIVLFLERIQGYHTRYRTFILWFLAGSNLIVNCIAAVLAMVQCDPVRKLWDEDVPGVCPGRRRIQIFGYIQGSWSAVCDFALALFPIILVARVHTFSIGTRIGLIVLMSFGVVAGACTIVKTAQLHHLTNLGDATKIIANVIVWNETEMWVVFIVSCIPPTKIFFMMAFKHAFEKCSGGFTSILSIRRSREPQSDYTQEEPVTSRDANRLQNQIQELELEIP